MNFKKGGLLTSSVLPLVAVGLVFSADSASAATVTVNAVNSGYYNLYGAPNGTASNIAQWGDSYRSWLGFDLSTIEGVITGATLQVQSDSRNSSGQTIKWWDITSPYSGLGTVSGIPGKSIFSDMGGGTLFGEGTHTAGTLNSFVLNASAIASLNQTESLWAIAGQNTVANYAFGYQNGVGNRQTIRLVLDVQPGVTANVPEAGSTLAFTAVCFAGLAGVAARRKARA